MTLRWSNQTLEKGGPSRQQLGFLFIQRLLRAAAAGMTHALPFSGALQHDRVNAVGDRQPSSSAAKTAFLINNSAVRTPPDAWGPITPRESDGGDDSREIISTAQ